MHEGLAKSFKKKKRARDDDCNFICNNYCMIDQLDIPADAKCRDGIQLRLDKWKHNPLANK